jgi:hypothetical protein
MAAALKTFEDNLGNLNVFAPGMAMQLCGPGHDSTHIFGIMVTSNATFTPIQEAIKTWTNATYLPFSGSTNFSGQATFLTPLLAMNGTTNATMPNNATSLQAQKRHSRYLTHHAHHKALHSRALRGYSG